MLFLRLLLGFTFVGTLLAGPEEELMECLRGVQIEELSRRYLDSDNLERECPVLLQNMDCIDKGIKAQIGMNIDEVVEAFPANSVPGRGARLLYSFRGVLQEMCNPGSSLNTALKENSECMMSVVNSEIGGERASAAYDAYKELEDAVQEQAGGNEDEDNRECIMAAYNLAYIAAEIHDNCSQNAFDTYTQIIRRSGMLRYGLCSENDLEKIKTSFLDSLDMEAGRKELFRLAFEFRKRRK